MWLVATTLDKTLATPSWFCPAISWWILLPLRGAQSACSNGSSSLTVYCMHGVDTGEWRKGARQKLKD